MYKSQCKDVLVNLGSGLEKDTASHISLGGAKLHLNAEVASLCRNGQVAGDHRKPARRLQGLRVSLLPFVGPGERIEMNAEWNHVRVRRAR